ncbi:hypothetical protein MSAN_02391300 [Mycena sanguinolenta]|uniref:Uncharacterized protein n=1 Tax=Mycena sanguinolenta TaxID=230812 RepID=A0A8H6X529_9AGAR|nr:hypothetical protein MSAN_02391300 [Mycena sanguinolenta]
MPNATLPPEIFDIIIGHAQDDTGRPVSLQKRNVQRFVHLFTHPLSTIRPHIRCLEILGSSSVRGSDSFDSDWLDPFIGALASLPSVNEMLLQNIVWGRMNPSTRSALLVGFQALAHLEVRAAQFDSVTHLVQLVSSKPLLQILSVDDLGWEDASFDPAQRVSGALHSLRLSNCYKRDILDWLASHDPLPRISHIQLGSVYPEDTHSIGRFLRRLGPHLSILQLEFSSLDAGGDAEDFCARVDLAHNSNLRTLILDKFINYSEYQFSSAVGWIPELLSRTPNLREASFGGGDSRLAGAASAGRPNRLARPRQSVQLPSSASAIADTAVLDFRHGRA